LLEPWKTPNSVDFINFLNPAFNAMNSMPEPKSQKKPPLKMSFEAQLRALVRFHPEKHTPVQYFLQSFKEDNFARKQIAPVDWKKY